MAIRNGTLVKITMGGVEISNLTTTAFNLTMASRDTSTKDTGAAETSLPTRYTGEASGEVLFDEAATYGYEEMFDALIAGTVGVAVYTTGVTADMEYTVSVYYTAVDLTDPDMDNSAVSFTLKQTGLVVKSAVPI